MKIGVSYGKTVNLGNYESLRVDATLEIDVPESEVSSAYDLAWIEVKEQVNSQVKGR